MSKNRYTIAQFSDMHCGDARFDPGLMQTVIDQVNAARPDMVAIPGDLTANGYQNEFDEAAEWIARLECDHVVVIPGNHDERNVGWELYEKVFGPRWYTETWSFGVTHRGRMQTDIFVAAIDSSKPDLNDGEVGRNRYPWIFEAFDHCGDSFRLLVMHHHLVSVPGTGRERNIVWDAGDVLQVLEEIGADLVLAGHKHVPYVYDVNGTVLSMSGTCATWRTRGFTPPSWTLATISPDQMVFEIRPSSGGVEMREVVHRHAKPEIR